MKRFLRSSLAALAGGIILTGVALSGVAEATNHPVDWYHAAGVSYGFTTEVENRDNSNGAMAFIHWDSKGSAPTDDEASEAWEDCYHYDNNVVHANFNDGVTCIGSR